MFMPLLLRNWPTAKQVGRWFRGACVEGFSPGKKSAPRRLVVVAGALIVVVLSVVSSL